MSRAIRGCSLHVSFLLFNLLPHIFPALPAFFPHCCFVWVGECCYKCAIVSEKRPVQYHHIASLPLFVLCSRTWRAGPRTWTSPSCLLTTLWLPRPPSHGRWRSVFMPTAGLWETTTCWVNHHWCYTATFLFFVHFLLFVQQIRSLKLINRHQD